MDPTWKIGLVVLFSFHLSLLVAYLVNRYLSRRAAARALPAKQGPRRVHGRPVTHEAVRQAPAGSLFRMKRGNFNILFRKVSQTHVKLLRGRPFHYGEQFHVNALRPPLDCPSAYILIQGPKA